MTVTIIGAGLAGSEVAWQLAEAGHSVRLVEMKPKKHTPAQKSDTFAELVCSNSFRSANVENAVGLLKEELRRLGSFVLQAADATKVPAGDALAVDRDQFSRRIHDALHAHPKISVVLEEVTELPAQGPAVIATGPLTGEALAKDLCRVIGQEQLYFYDAIAPIIAADSLNMDVVFAQSRYDKGDTPDYLNCPLNEDEYKAFVKAVCDGEKVAFKTFEKPVYFEGCLPIEVMAERGEQTLSFGPMKPVGLSDPRTGRQPHAVVQLRKENVAGTAYNLVGFQTKLSYPEQKRIFRMIPGLENVEFLRFGAVHRNTYVEAPRVLEAGMELKARPGVFLAGQMVGVEGYLESTAHGLCVAMALKARLGDRPWVPPPATSALGALLRHVMGADASAVKKYGPENVHWGMVPPLLGKVKKIEKKARIVERARGDFNGWMLDFFGCRSS
ncbi:MAG: methylenetetrahydrofolate--tRNA-(uracil(54)-C(5))-methyltransferase (FADH(2)-oxidizing) TrmFO [Deltaproteobacteria bacterium]|nr:methylenetetrahydrofolate--tRNA-(uracil(54)-C(5))-methyltransferase (FADH(2)-oxidizing) TrmFO [Deltaproteobacteria bacterium]